MSLRVVLYVEGAGERLGLETKLTAPGERLDEEQLGAAHVLLRRGIATVSRVPEAAVQFEQPLALDKRLPRGSDLHDKRKLRRLLTWLAPHRRPDLAVVLVDTDDDLSRATRLESELGPVLVTHVIAAAVRESESWLLAAVDAHDTVNIQIERLPPGGAKEQLARSLPETTGRSPRARRIELASSADLGVIRRRCASFDHFLRELQSRLARS